MSDSEFDVLDALYFVTPYQELSEGWSGSEGALLIVLKSLFEKGWMRCYKSVDEEVSAHEIDWENGFKGYYYLASKEGLLVHNGMG